MRTTIIAEFGSSPMPAWDFAPWCAAAANAGADSVKIQLWRTDSLYPPHMRAAMRDREFPRVRLDDFVMAAHAYGLSAGASVFDDEAVALAARSCDFLKLAASQQDSELFLKTLNAARQQHKPLYRSVSDPDKASSLAGQTTLYAIQQYPAPMGLSLLRLLQFKLAMRGVPWGWSSHTTGALDVLLAARLGASVAEKHFAMTPADCEAPHSLLPGPFAVMCRAIRKGA